MKIAVELFIIGIAVSFGPCLASCGQVILPYIAATKRGWREGFKATIIFSFTCLVVYVILGLLAGLLGRMLVIWFRQFGYLIFLTGGIFVSIIGVIIILSKGSGHRFCQFLNRQVADDDIKGPVLLGLTLSILPCLPLLGVLAYIALRSQNLWEGAFYGFAFGLGKFISPVIPLGVLAGGLSKGVAGNSRINIFFKWLCGIILFLIGLSFVIPGLLRQV